jgi:hypothetical protein
MQYCTRMTQPNSPRTILIAEGLISGPALDDVRRALGQAGSSIFYLEYENVPPPPTDVEIMAEAEIRQEIEQQALRIFNSRLNPSYLPIGTEWPVDWAKKRTKLSFHLAGDSIPEWLYNQGILMTSDAEAIKIGKRPLPLRDYASKGELRVGTFSWPGEPQDKEKPPAVGGSKDYHDLETEFLGPLLVTLRRVKGLG